jgi:hypothetical protein
MGGRKPSSIKRVLGVGSFPQRIRQPFETALHTEEPSRIAKATVRLFLQSKGGIANLAKGLQMLSAFKSAPTKKMTEDEAKAYASEYFAKKKESHKISTIPEIDRLIIESASRALSKRGAS